MKEITRVITAQITVIEKMSNDDADALERYKEDAAEVVKATLSNYYKADDVKVSIKDIIRDI